MKEIRKQMNDEKDLQLARSIEELPDLDPPPDLLGAIMGAIMAMIHQCHLIFREMVNLNCPQKGVTRSRPRTREKNHQNARKANMVRHLMHIYASGAEHTTTAFGHVICS